MSKGLGANKPRHANDELWEVVYPVVQGATKSWRNAHPEVLPDNGLAGWFLTSLVKRICNQLTAPDVEARIKAAILSDDQRYRRN